MIQDVIAEFETRSPRPAELSRVLAINELEWNWGGPLG
jgi:hypothetical protein